MGFVIVRYRRNGVLKRFKATPLSAFEFVSAQVLSRFFIVAFISVVIFAGTDLVLHFRMAGSWALLALVNALAILCMIALGLVFSSRIKSEEVAGGIMNLITWPMMILSGVFFSLEGTPRAMQVASRAFPITYYIEASRSIMLDGAGFAASGRRPRRPRGDDRCVSRRGGGTFQMGIVGLHCRPWTTTADISPTSPDTTGPPTSP